MPLKMNQLVKLTDTPKSTILYYIKEGLLPEPHKVKPNVHLYDDDFVERIRFIKYLQNNFHATISQIRSLLQHNDFDFSRGFEAVLDMLDTLTGPSSARIYTEEEVCDTFGISKEKLRGWLDEGALFMREGGFSEKEIEIISILLELERFDGDRELLGAYVKHAKELSKLEVELAEKLLGSNSRKNEIAKGLFDAALILKPYLFNMHLVHMYQKRGGGS